MTRTSIAVGGLLGMLAIAGCGGGSGGDDAGGGAATFTVSPSTITFTANHDDPEPPPAQTVTVSTNRSGATYFQFEGGGATGLNCGGSSCTFQIRPDAPYSYVDPATVNGSRTVVGCADLQCASEVGRATVNWTYTINPGTDVAPASQILVSGVEGVAPDPVEIAITHPSGAVPAWQASFSPSTGSSSLAVAFTPASTAAPSPSGGTVQVQIAPIASLGTYSGSIEVRPNGGPRTIRRTLSYEVIPALNVTSTATFTLNAGSTSAALQKNITIGSNYPAGAAPIDWTAAEDSPWLDISPSNGNTSSANQLTLSLSSDTLERLPKGVHHATVTVSSPPGTGMPARSDVVLDVVLDMQLPLVNYAMPRTVLVSASGETWIRGSGFTTLPGTVTFGGSSATTVNRVDDTLVRATHAALNSPGTYSLDLGVTPNALGLNRSRAQVVAIAPPAYAAASLASSGEKYAAVFDDERNALYVADVENGEVERYRYASGTWTADALAVAELKDIALMPDGAQLIALTGDGLTLIDPAALTVIGTHSLPSISLPNRTLAISNDGQISFSRADDNGAATNGGRYDLNLRTLTAESGCCADRYIRASGDGSVLYFVASLNQAYKQDTRTREYAFSPSFSDPPTALSVSRDGSRLMIDATRLLDSSFASIATLSTGGEALTAGVLTADGTRAYAYADSGTLYAFNVDVSPGSSVVQIGSPITLPASVGAKPKLAVSLDGRTVFIAGDARVIVQPGPP